MKRKRYFKALVSLALGAVLLSGAALANYDNASGYSMLKNSLLKMQTEENFSATADVVLDYNGEMLHTVRGVSMYDRNGATSSYSASSYNDGGTHESWTQDGCNIYKYDTGEYALGTAYSKGFNDSYLSSTAEEKDMTDKTVAFVELIADTMVGDLKNNFVLTDSSGGQSTYQINLQTSQIPALIQSGMSLLFSSYRYDQANSGGYVTCEDFEVLLEAISEEEYDALFEAAWTKIAGTNQIAYIKSDGSIVYYADQDAYLTAMGYTTDSFDIALESAFNTLLDSDPVIERVGGTFSFDSHDRITEAQIEGTLAGYDASGAKQTCTLTLNVSISDYGTTTIAPFDTSLLDFDWEKGITGYNWYNFDANGNLVP